MNATERVHVGYVIGILVAIIILLLTVQWGSIKDLSQLISFALTLASLILALLAIVYSFFSNASLAQSLSTLTRVAGEVQDVSETITNSTSRLRAEIASIPSALSEVSRHVSETHDIVRQLANKEEAPEGAHRQANLEADAADTMIRIAAPTGFISMYAAAVAHSQSKPLDPLDLARALNDEDSGPYHLGWLMALDAAGIIDLRTSPPLELRVADYDAHLLRAVLANADRIRRSEIRDSRTASVDEVDAVDRYFASHSSPPEQEASLPVQNGD